MAGPEGAEREYTLDDLKNDIQPEGARLKLLHKPADYEDAPHLSEADKEVVGKMLLDRLKVFGSEETLPGAAFLNDPDSYLVYNAFFSGIKKLLADMYLDAQVRSSVLDLIYVNVMKHRNCQFGWATYIENYVGRETFDVRKTVMIDFPDADIYSPEERLAIRFSKAVLDNTMTDEIFSEAVERWGPRITLRLIYFIGAYLTTCLLTDTLNIVDPYNGVPSDYRHAPKSWEHFDSQVEEEQGFLAELQSSRENGH